VRPLPAPMPPTSATTAPKPWDFQVIGSTTRSTLSSVPGCSGSHAKWHDQLGVTYAYVILAAASLSGHPP
jgi:hypothetical protein